MVGESDVLEGQVIFHSTVLFIDDDSTSLRIESSNDSIFSKIDR